MENIRHYRITPQEGGWVGCLYVHNLFAWTLERNIGFMVPDGTYQIKLVDSPHFGPDTLWICQESGTPYDQAVHHVLIHEGNVEADSNACVLVGDDLDTIGTDTIDDSRKTLAAIKAVLLSILKTGEEVWITITTLK